MLTVLPFKNDSLVSVYLLSAAFADFRLKKQEVNATFNLKLPRASKGDNLLGSAEEPPKEELITPPSAVEPDGALPPGALESLPLQVSKPPAVEAPQEVVEPPPVVEVPQEVVEPPPQVVEVPPEVVEPPLEVAEPPQLPEVDNVENKEPEKFVKASPLDYNPNPHS